MIAAAEQTEHVLRFHGIHSSGGGQNQIADIEDQGGRYFFQERSYFPYNWFKQERIVYWATNQLFTSNREAEEACKQFGADHVQESFYCEDDAKTWFLVFADADKCLAFVAAKTGLPLRWLREDENPERQ